MLRPSPLIRALSLCIALCSFALVGCDDATPGTGGAGSTSASTGKGTSTATTTSSSASTSSGVSGSSSSGGGMGRSIAVANHGFEQDIVANGTFNDKITPQGWTLLDATPPIIGLDYNSRGVVNPTGTQLYVGGAPEGVNVALLFLWRAQTNGTPVGLGQETAEVIAPFTQYTLRVRVGNINGEPGFPYDLDGFPGYRVELRAGSTVLATESALAPPDGAFAESVIVHSIGASDPAIGQKLGVALFNQNGPAGIEVNFDDVRIDAIAVD